MALKSLEYLFPSLGMTCDTFLLVVVPSSDLPQLYFPVSDQQNNCKIVPEEHLCHINNFYRSNYLRCVLCAHGG